MSALTSLLVRDQVVPIRKIEEAIQRQVISGGDLEEVLLEMDAVPENVLSAYRAALFGLLPATRDEVMRAPRDVVRLVPREVAEQYQLVPLSAQDRTLVVAVRSPLPAEVDEQLAFLLGHDIVYRVVTETRLAAALAHHYGNEMAQRTRRLVEKLRAREAGSVPYVAPPQDEKVDRQHRDLPRKHIAIDWDDENTETVETRPPGERSTLEFGVPAGRAAAPSESTPSAPVPPSEHPSTEHQPSEHPPSEREPSEGPSSASSSKPTRRRAGQSPLRRRLRGPVTARDAVDLLADAEHRDDILAVFQHFARQFFDFTALFLVHEDIAEGRDAFGPGASPEQVARIAIPLDVPGVFGDVRSDHQARVVDLNARELDGIVARDLGRADAQPALILPVAIRGRTILILYGDRDGETLTLADVPEIVAFPPRVADAFERLILKRKRQGYGAGSAEARAALKAAADRARSSAPAGGNEVVAKASERRAPRDSGAAPASDSRDDGSEPPADRWAPGPSTESYAEPGGTGGEGGEHGEVPEPPMTAAAVGGGAVASASASPRRRPRRRADSPLEILGVPRSAPPPPGRATMDEEAADHRAEDHSETDPEITIEYDEQETEPRPSGHYRLRNAGSDVVGPGPIAPEDAPIHPAPGRPDPRRESGEHVLEERVRLPSSGVGSAVSSEPAPAPAPAPSNGAGLSTPSPPSPHEPTVIVDMGESVEALVDDLVGCGPDGEEAAVGSLLHYGEASLPALVQRFPGPLWFDRHTPYRRLPRGRDVSAIARAIVSFGDRAVPYVISLVGSRDSDRRFYAVLLSSEFPHRELLVPLSERIFDPDPGVQHLVLDVLKHFLKYEKEMEEILKGVRVEAKVRRRDETRQVVATHALGELRDRKSTSLLVDLLDAPDAELAHTAHRALVTLTRQDFGDSQRKWRQWLERNEQKHRIEWLIDALLHPEETLRSEACDELKALTQEYFGYHPASPKRDREIAQRKYRTWWEEEGRPRFAASN